MAYKCSNTALNWDNVKFNGIGIGFSFLGNSSEAIEADCKWICHVISTWPWVLRASFPERLF